MDGCRRVQDQMLEYALGTADQARSRTIQEHLAACPACQEALARLRDELALLRTDSLPAQKLGSDFRVRFWSEVERQKVTRRWWRMPGLLRWAAPATTIAIVLAVGWIVHRHAPPPAPAPDQPSIVAVPVAPPPPPPPSVPAPPPASPQPAVTPVQQADSAPKPSDEVLQDMELLRYMQYMEMIEEGEATGQVVLPGENGI